jgi:hypothetical protein
VERRTYVSTKGSHAEISLFHDVTLGSGTQSSTVTHKLEASEDPVVYIGTVTTARESGVAAEKFDLLVVREDGQIQCLDGDKLQEKWTSPASALGRDVATPIPEIRVEFVQLTTAYAASQGILKDRQGVLGLFPQEISEDGFNPDVLVIITRTKGQDPSRNTHVVALPRRTAARPNESKQLVEPLLTASLPTSKLTQHTFSFGAHASSGTVQQLSRSYLTEFDISGALPTEISQIKVKEPRSFLRLSNNSVMISSGTSITIYSSKFKSILASVPLPPQYAPQKEGPLAKGTINFPCNLVSYFPKLGTAVAIANTGLIAIQIEGKSRIDGLLIDSLGCSARGQTRPGRGACKVPQVQLTTIVSSIPGSMAALGWPSKADIKAMDDAVSTGDVVKFEEFMAEKLPLLSNVWGEGSGSSQTPRDIDRRWVIYALKSIFAWSKGEDGKYSLTTSFYPPNLFVWLLSTGNMTVANIELALREQIQQSGLDSIPPGELVDAIVEMDPQMDLLFALVSVNFLGAAELLAALRRLMESLELFGEGAATRQMMLTSGEESNLENGDIEEQVAALEAEAEADLAMAEYQLGPGSGIRGEALSLALSKLYTCPTKAIVYALQTTYTSQEIVSLIYLLRFEMARGAWTSRYLDDEQLDVIDNETGAPDNTIRLIASLLSNCIDAVGAGGWLSGHARLVSSNRFEAEELISSLKLEVSAALEGLEEAAYLKGLTSEMVRYGDVIQDGPAGKKQKTSHKMGISIAPEQEVKFLPLGLKAEQQVSQLRVGAGGEVSERSLRDIGRLKSQKVGKYSLERIVV